jgi:putative transposase
MTTIEKHHRRSIRLRDYDYTQPGAYFVTICIEGRPCLLGEIEGDVMRLNDAGRMVQTTWEAMPAQHPGVEIDAFVVMPNHIHGIIVLVGASFVGTHQEDDVPLRATTRVAPTGNNLSTRVTTRATPTEMRQPENVPMLGDVVGAFKSLTTDAYIYGVKTLGWPSFQRRL